MQKMESQEIDTVVASNFRRAYEQIQKRNTEISMIPKNVLDIVEATTQKMIGVG